MNRLRIGVVLAPLLLGSALAVPPDDLAPARRDFDALVRTISGGIILVPSGPSPNERARRFLSRSPATTRQVCEEAWTRARRWGTRANHEWDAVRVVLRFAMGPAPAPGTDSPERARGFVQDRSGAVLLRLRGLWGGPTLPAGAELPSFEDIVGKGEPRQAPKPSPDGLFGLMARQRVEAGGTGGDEDESRMRGYWVAMALGEACRGNGDATRRLLEQCRRFPDDSMSLVAAGWSEEAELRTWLGGRVRDLAAEPGPARWPDQRLVLACTALAHASEDALVGVVDGLAAEARSRVHREFGTSPWIRRLVAEVGRSTDPAERIMAMDRLLGRLVHRPDTDVIPGALLPPIAVLLDEAVKGPDPEIRREALRAARHVFDPWAGSGLHGWSRSNGDTHREVGSQLGNYPSPEAFLDRLVRDLREGRIGIRDEPPGVFEEEPISVMPPDTNARSDMPCPVPFFSGAQEEGASPVHVSARWMAEGLRLTARNTWTSPWALHPTFLRHSTADRLAEVIGQSGKPVRRIEELRLGPGWLASYGPGWGVPASGLVILRPGESWSWTVPVRPEDRSVDCVVLRSGATNISIEGVSSVPVLDDFGTVWVPIARE